MQALTTELSAFTGVILKELRGCLSGDLWRCFHRHNLKKFGQHALSVFAAFLASIFLMH